MGCGAPSMRHPESMASLVGELKACSKRRDVQKGKMLHFAATESGMDCNILVANTLVSMYAKCGCLAEARQVFEAMLQRDVVSWNALLFGYAEKGHEQVTLDLLPQMQLDSCAPNPLSFLAALKACTCLAEKEAGELANGRKTKSLGLGRAIHACASASGCDSHMFVANALVDMYAKCGCMVEARRIFDEQVPCYDVVLWTSLILGYAENGECSRALELLASMKCKPNALTFVAAIKACTTHIARGMAVHRQTADFGFDSELMVANTLIDMYSKCGSMDAAEKVFNVLPSRSVVSWNALMFGYVENGQAEAALRLFSRMPRRTANAVSYAAALKACGSIVALELGKSIHEDVRALGMEKKDPLVACALVDMYSKCGSMVEAQLVFDSMATRARGVFAWTALMAGYSRHGEAGPVFDLFERMCKELRPNAVTLLCVLSACKHAGLTERGRELLEVMASKYGITPDLKHFTCVVDMLGRANELEAALGMIERMPFQPDAVLWTTLLASCAKWKNVEVGRRAFDALVAMEDKDATAYVLMGNIYRSKGMWEEQSKLRLRRASSPGGAAIPACWWSDAKGVVHPSQPERMSKKVHAKLEQVMVRVREMTGECEDGADEQVDQQLCGHGERLAIALSLLKTPPGTTIRIRKQGAVCDGCHSVVATISKLEQREIVCRDESRFHVYKDGKCSCGAKC